MTYILTWLSLVITSLGLVFIGRWVKKEAQVYVLVGLTIVVISLVMTLTVL